MAVAPLFLVDMQKLKARLRLAGVETCDAAQSQVDGATRTVRGRFYARLGTTRVATLVGYTSTENPTSNNEILRSIAEEVEAKWVWLELTRNMPLKFYDNSGDDLEQHSLEGAFRSLDPDRLREAQDRCGAEIEAWIPILAGEVGLGDAKASKVHTQADMPGGRPYPLASLVGKNKNLFGNPRRFKTSSG